MTTAAFKMKTLMRGSTALVAFAIAGAASAKEFKVNDDISITTNVTVSAGISFRTEDPSSEAILPGNGARIGVAGVAASATQDDGTLNFDKGDVVNAPISVVADAEFNYRDDIGFFIRGKGVFDAALDNSRVNHGNTVNGFAAGEPLSDEGFNTLAKFATATILDAFVFGEVEVADTPIELRVGRQVVSWGESTFIQNGINSINPIDVTAFRRPGVQLKEGLLPLGMIYANAGLGDNVSLEGFWNFEWQQTQPDGCGTFFSTADVVSQGCNTLSLASVGAVAGAGLAAEAQAGIDTLNAAIGQVSAGIAAAQAAGNAAVEAALTAQLGGLQGQLAGAEAGLATAISLGNDEGALANGFFLNRSGDSGPNDFEADQFGVAARLFVDEIDTEFGFYFTRLASRLPFLSFQTGTIAAPIPALGNTPGAATYFVDYPERINTLGISAATTLFGLAVSGEMSYRNNQPVQVNTNDLTLAAFTQGNSAAFGVATNPSDALFANATGTKVEGFIRTDQVRGQATVVAFFDRILGADRITTVGELGFEWLPNLDGDNPLNLNLGRASVFGNPNSAGNTAEGLTSKFSASFQGRASAAYTNVFAGVNMTPSLSVKQDLVGYSSDSQFIEGRTALGWGLAFDYLNKYTLALNYTTSFGGTFNAFDDRDFASAVFSVQF